MNNTLIVGFNKEAIELYEKIIEYPALGYKIIGFVTLKKLRSISPKKLLVLGTINSIKENIKQHNIRIILIAIAPNQHSYLKRIINICIECNTKYQIVSEVYDIAYGNIIRDIYKDLLQYRELNTRRIVDLVGSILLLVILFPLFIIIASMIIIELPGSIFYSQLRLGKNGKPFRLYKFRVNDTEDLQKSVKILNSFNEHITTNVGNFLKKTRIDELPQLLNILTGDMSFIGPNPERPFFVDSFKQQIPFYHNRLKIKPGITGWAQVKWEYDETIEDIKEKLSYDLHYINNRSIKFDLKIIFLTITELLNKKK